MTKLAAALLASTLASTLITAGFTLPLAAQTAAVPPPAPAAQSVPPAVPPARPEETAAAARHKAEAADRAALFEAHLAALHAGLTLTPDQDQLWPAAEQAIRGFARMRMDLHDMRMDARQDREEADGAEEEDPVDALKAYSERLLARAQALTALSEAIQPLYASMSEDQKRRIPLLLHDMAPKQGPIARMVERLDGDGDEGPNGPTERDRPRMGHRWNDRSMDDHGERDWRRTDRADRDGERDWPRRHMDQGAPRDGASDHARDGDQMTGRMGDRMTGHDGPDDGED